MSEKLLSICIPTYNRAEILRITLDKLYSNPDFDHNLIEVIVSDNCSTDHTSEVVKDFQHVKYYRNHETILAGYNFTKSIEYANSKYVKIFNDTFSFKPNSLKSFLERIKANENDSRSLFFFPCVFKNRNNVKEVNSIEEFVKECSFYMTWSVSIGFWKSDFDKILQKNKYSDIHFPHLEWFFSILRENLCIIYFEDFYDILLPQNKGGYNIFKTFVVDYLQVLREQSLSFRVYELEKYRLCRFFLYPWLVNIFIDKRSNYTFKTEGFFQIIFKRYWYEPYFYLLLIFLFIKYILGFLKFGSR